LEIAIAAGSTHIVAFNFPVPRYKHWAVNSHVFSETSHRPSNRYGNRARARAQGEKTWRL